MRGGARKGAGRPRKEADEQRTAYVRVLLTAAEKRAIDAAAEREEMEAGAWLREAGLRAAKRRRPV